MANESARLKAVVDVIGVVALVLGLVFVGFELRSNTEAVRAATFQSLTDISNDYVMEIAANPELARIYHTATAEGLAALAPSREMWPEHRPILTPAFAAFVEDCWGARR